MKCPLLWGMLGQSFSTEASFLKWRSLILLDCRPLKSEPRQEKLVSYSERDPICRARGVFLCVTDLSFNWGTCSRAYIGGSFIFCDEQENAKLVKALYLLQSSLANEDHIYAGIQKVLIYFPFVPFRPFTPFLLLSSSCCSCANRSGSVSAICAPEPTNAPALHGVLPSWGSALHELHCVLPQVKQRRKQAGTKMSFCSNRAKPQRNIVCCAKGLCYQEQLVRCFVQGNNFRISRDFPSFRVFQVVTFFLNKCHGVTVGQLSFVWLSFLFFHL